jgi:preprotein translocase subunit YajC
MFDFLNSLVLMAPPAGQGGSGGGFGSMLPTLLMFGGIILVMYFLMIRPQQKRQKEHQQMVQSLKKGDKVVTNAGIHGTITDVDDKTIEVQIADNVKVRFEKASVAAKN